MHSVIGIAYPTVQLKPVGYTANKGTKTNPLYQTIDMDMIAVHISDELYFFSRYDILQ
jgi:hypothetical protein